MKLLAKQQLEGLEKCPQCGIAKPLLSYKTCVPYPYPKSNTSFHWVVYQCSACNDIVCVLINAAGSSMISNALGHLSSNNYLAYNIIPAPRIVAGELPDRPRRYIEQAISSLHAPDGATMLAGSAVDAMLKLKGYEEGSVYKRIENAVKDGALTQEMSDWAHAVRLEANKPRHADLNDPHATHEAAKQTIEFAEALGEYLFVLPARIERGKIAANEAAKVDQTNSEPEVF